MPKKAAAKSSRLGTTAELERWREEIKAGYDPEKLTVAMCTGTACRASRAMFVLDAFKEELAKRGMQDKVRIIPTGCHGFCEQGPLMVIRPKGIFYHSLKPEDMPEIVQRTLIGGEPIEKHLYVYPETGQKAVYERDVPFYSKQTRLTFGENVNIDPTSIEDYIRIGGYSALSKALFKMKPADIVEEVRKAGLRGRGGGGFDTARKWDSSINAAGDEKYVICNADEGDPGAYSNRSLLEGNPHSVLEGIIIGAYAVGSSQGYIYVREEYPLAVQFFRKAVEDAETYGLLGENILGSGFNFTMRIERGGGAFVCGESTALMASIEGKAGEPRAKYVHTAERGLYNKPTVLNNVETWANVPLIVNKGSEWFASIGTKGSKGTKIFSLVGNVNNSGLVEVPMGITLREIIYGIGGGIPKGKKFKAIQTGGPSGGCIPENLLDLAVDFDTLWEAGSMMGSGGMIVMDENTCMVDVAKFFTRFLKDESCGKCVPCREGLAQTYELLDRITQGEGKEEDLEMLEELGKAMQDSSLCALGTSAANPVLSTLRFFRDEYVAHINEKRCPAAACKALIYFDINENCTGCTLCARNCPVKAITGETKKLHKIDQETCIQCGVCADVCKFNAVSKNSPRPARPPSGDSHMQLGSQGNNTPSSPPPSTPSTPAPPPGASPETKEGAN